MKEASLAGGLEAHAARVERAVALARELQARAMELQTPQERRQQAELDRMLAHPGDKATLVQMTDQAFRSHAARRTADQFIHILDVQGVPRFFSPLERTLLRGFQSFGGYAPGVAVPLMKDRLHRETANVILPAERELLTGHLQARRAEGVRMNLNFLGEAVLGEAEAERRLEALLEALGLPEVEVVSVKISTLYSQVSALARSHTVAVLCDRLELLYRTAARMRFLRSDGTEVPKFVYLDMEEYRDMHLTAEAFMRTLERPGLEQAGAGLALQAYLPDSAGVQRTIQAWARRRVAAGGGPVTVRLVKGANMEMERVEAALRGWPQAPFRTKAETDAQYKRMVLEAMRPENLAAVRLGLASHNLFDLAFGLVLAAEAQAGDRVQFEMLEGMANHQRRALFERAHNLLLYAPACPKEDFLSAIGYLIRRLDENTGPDNFLRHAFRLRVDSEEWRGLEAGFRAAFAGLAAVDEAPRRTQDRRQPAGSGPRPERAWDRFENEPDTDFALGHNVEWVEGVLARWKVRVDGAAPLVPLVIDGQEWAIPEPADSGLRRDALDPSRPGVVVARYRPAGAAEVARAVACAGEDADGWRRLEPSERSAVLGRVAHELRAARGDLIGAALANGGKTVGEADPEVSEAVDFCEFYRGAARHFQEGLAGRAQGKGVVVVVSPWNFPIAIPCGGIAAALAAGNTVILKPASDAVLPAWELCQCFWRAGVSRRVLQFVPCAGGGPGAALVADPGVAAVILTGGTQTALSMLRAQPALPLYAETGGKNAMMVTALADREQAIKHVVQSAFGHAGQKCSAASLLLLEDEVYDDPHFKASLCDAVHSLKVGSAWDLATKVGPLIRPPAGDLETALKTLGPGESWAVLPRNLEGNPNLWSPGVKWGVTPGSDTHRVEFFGPVLGVMRFSTLAEGMELVNQTGYGLTSGLQSLDDREQAEWKAGIRAGNLYLNRPTTGALVLRQPFGGMGKSCFGPGLKAGGPNYVAQFMRFADGPVPAGAGGRPLAHPALESFRQRLLAAADPGLAAGRARLLAALDSYDRRAREEFGVAHDQFRLLGQDNLRRYLPVGEIRLGVHPADTFFDLAARACAAAAVGSGVTVSVPAGGAADPRIRWLEELTEDWAGGIEFVEETEAELAAVVRAEHTDRLRYAGPDRVPSAVRAAAAGIGLCVCDSPVVAEGRVELLWYVLEQSVSLDYHRYGNLGARLGEERAPVI
ncbi:MAG: hypothetical protein RJA22_2897 [Verrucomicrobiota bacterium]